MQKKTIMVYSIPAYGHVYSTLYLMQRLQAEGYAIIYYASEPFRKAVEAHGGQFRGYPMDPTTIDLTDGKRLLRLYRLLLEHTAQMLPKLLKEAKKERPIGIIFDSLALWGRAVSTYLHLPGFSFYSIAAIDRLWGKSFWYYTAFFSSDFFSYVGELPKAFGWRQYLKRRYCLSRLGLLDVMMNRGDYNLMGYTRQMQPGGQKFGKEYLFLGSLSSYRRLPSAPVSESKELFLDAEKLVVYISLGTIFNDDQAFFDMVITQLAHQPVQVIMTAQLDPAMTAKLPANFMTSVFLNQTEILRHTDVFVSAGGMNSIHEALLQGVPCLLYPQQGEQYLNARQFETLGFGLILKKPNQLRAMIKKTAQLKEHWSEEKRASLTRVSLNKALRIIKDETSALPCQVLLGLLKEAVESE